MTKNKHFSATVCTIFVFIAVGILAFFFAPTHDDLIRLNCMSFKDAFGYALFFGNGRFLGNSTVAVFLNNDIMDALMRTIVLSGTIVLSAIVAYGYKTSAIILSSFLYLGISVPIFRESYVWGHGFYNYVPPVFCLLVTLALIKWCIVKDSKKLYYICTPIVFITSYAAQLFIENSSTINGLVLLLVVVWAFKTNKGIVISLSSLIGSALGAACMFLGPVLLGVGDRLNGYRSVSSGLSELLETCIKNALVILNNISANWGLWFVVSSLILLYAKMRTVKLGLVYKIALVIFPILSVLQGFNSSTMLKLAVDAIFFVYIICVAVAFYKLFEKGIITRILLVLGIAVASLLQLLVVSPIGPRCMFVTVAILAVGVLYIFSIVNQENPNIIKKYINTIACLAIVVYIALLVIYIQAFQVHCVRMEYGFEQLENGSKQIEIIELPYAAMFHCPNESYVYSYTFNHGDMEEMSFVYISYQEYLGK